MCISVARIGCNVINELTNYFCSRSNLIKHDFDREQENLLKVILKIEKDEQQKNKISWKKYIFWI